MKLSRTSALNEIKSQCESDRRYAIELLMQIDNAGPHTHTYTYPKGKWCDWIIGYLLQDDLIEIKERVYNYQKVQPGRPQVGYFYVTTYKGKLRIKHIVQKAFEGTV